MTDFTYGCEHRPPSWTTLPVMPTPALISTDPLSGNLAEVGRHGSVNYSERLKARDAEHFSLWLILDVEELASEIAAEMDYPEENLELYAEEPRFFEQSVGQIADRLVVRADVSREDLAKVVAGKLAA